MVEIKVYANHRARKKNEAVAIFKIDIVPEEVEVREIPDERKDDPDYIEAEKQRYEQRVEQSLMDCKTTAIQMVRDLCAEVANNGVPILVAKLEEPETEDATENKEV